MRPAGAVFPLVVLLFVTPHALASAWINHGPFGGRINALAVDPLDDRRIVAGTDAGVFESRDAGVTFRKLHDVAHFEVTHVVIDPRNPSTMYVAYGALESYFLLLFRDSRLFKTTDGGQTWSELGEGLPASKSVASLVIDPDEPLRLWAGLQCGIRSFKGTPETNTVTTAEGIYRSEDGGETWAFSSSGLTGEGLCVRGLAIDPVTDALYGYSEVLVSHWMTRSSISSDAGVSWSVAPSPAPTSGIVIHPAAPSRRFGLRNGFDGGAVLMSEDGLAWRSISEDLTRLLYTSFHAITLDPDNPDGLFVATGRGAYRTGNLGANWVRVSPFDVGPALSIVKTAGGTIYLGTATGLFVSRDDSMTWNLAEVRHIATSIDQVEVDPGDPNHVLARVVDDTGPLSLMRSTDAGVTWQNISSGLPRSEQPGFPHESRPVLAIDAAGTAYTTAAIGVNGEGRTIHALPRGANAWRELPSPGAFPQFLLASKTEPGRVWVFTYPGAIHRSVDSGTTWTKGGNLPANIRGVALDPRSGALYVSAEGDVLRSTDSGTTWTNVLDADIYSISVSAADGVAYAFRCCDTLYRSADGTNWERMTAPGGDIRGVLADPKRSGVVYAWGVHSGIYRSDDGGRSWCRFDEGLTTNRINWMAADALGRKLYAATFRDGVFSRTPEAVGRQRSIRR